MTGVDRQSPLGSHNATRDSGPARLPRALLAGAPAASWDLSVSRGVYLPAKGEHESWCNRFMVSSLIFILFLRERELSHLFSAWGWAASGLGRVEFHRLWSKGSEESTSSLPNAQRWALHGRGALAPRLVCAHPPPATLTSLAPLRPQAVPSEPALGRVGQACGWCIHAGGRSRASPPFRS